MPRIPEDYGWRKFWSLTILSQKVMKIKWRSMTVVDAICICWIVKEYRMANIKTWSTVSCWCMRWKHWNNKRPVQTTHGMYWTRPYNIRTSMKASCNKKTHPSYHRRWWKWLSYYIWWDTFEWRRKDNKAYYKDNLYFTRKDLAIWFTKDNCIWMSSYWVSKFDLREE